MILNLLNTMLITLGTGTSVLTMPKKQINPPINRAINNFTTTLSENDIAATETDDSNNMYQYTQEIKLSGNNTGMMIKGNKIIQNMYYHSQNSTEYLTRIEVEDGNYPYQLYTPRLLTVLQITTYENTQNIEEQFTMYTLIGADVGQNPANVVEKIKIRTTTYQSQEDWSQYIDRNDYASWNYIYFLQKEIERPENGYRYSKTEQLTEPQDQWGTECRARIETGINLTKGTTTYIIQIAQPIVEVNSSYTGNGIVNYINTSVYNPRHFIYRAGTNNTQITGQLIIPEGTTEIVDIPGLMFQVLTMPFTFISAAFNLTLFPGTPYQINISNLFMAIIAVMAFIFILKLLIGMKGGN